MSVVKLNGILFKKMIINAAINLKNHCEEIDKLNVFPVPDGDTGTNMQMTMFAGVREIQDVASKSITEITKMLSRGLLMGARGNSGVILSQFFRGVYLGFSKVENGSATLEQVTEALISGYKTAYKAVMDPKEGTILTVVREAALEVEKNKNNYKNLDQLLNEYLKFAKISLENTPNLLPVLKEAGVVDSGGTGFVRILEGMILALEGKMLTLKEETQTETKSGIQALENVDIKFGYCTEFILNLKEPSLFDESFLKDPYSNMGDSLVCVVDDDLVKIHVHTNQPGTILNIAQEYGEFKTLKIENMRLQHSELLDKAEIEENNDKIQERKKYGIISVCNAPGVKKVFCELGCHYIIDGGQTMNPSADQFLKAIEIVNAENVIILPNNSNIILAAEQSKKLLDGNSSCNVEIIKNKSIASGYAALLLFDESESLEENINIMTEKVNTMNVGELTYAVRTTEVNGVKVNESDYIGIANGKLVCSLENKTAAAKELLSHIVSSESEIVTIFYGTKVSDSEIEELSDYIRQIDSLIEIEIIASNDDLYDFLVAVE